MLTTQASKTNPKIDHHDWGFYDAQGREYGLIVTTYEAEYVATNEPGGSSLEPGYYYIARCQPARNGKPFGAGQCLQYFMTRQERDVYLCKRIGASLKQAKAKSVC